MHHHTLVKLIHFVTILFQIECSVEHDLVSITAETTIANISNRSENPIINASSVVKMADANVSTDIDGKEFSDQLGFRPPLKPCLLNSDCENKCCVYRFKSNGLCVDRASPGEVCGFGQEIVSTILMQVYKVCDECDSGCCCGTGCCPTNQCMRLLQKMYFCPTCMGGCCCTGMYSNNQCCAVGYCTIDVSLGSSTPNPHSESGVACLECSSGCCCGEKKTCCLSGLCKGSRQGLWCKKCVSGCCCGELCCASAFCDERPSTNKFLVHNFLQNALMTNGFSLTSRPDLIHTTTALHWAPPPKYLPDRSAETRHGYNYATIGGGTANNLGPSTSASYFSKAAEVNGRFCWICHSLCCCGDSCCPKYVCST